MSEQDGTLQPNSKGQGLAAASEGPTGDPQAVLDSLLEAQNAHDTQAVLDCFAENATVTLMVETLEGEPAIRQWQEQLAADHFHIELQGAGTVNGDRVAFTAQVNQDSVKTLGLAHLPCEGEVILRNGKVEHYMFKLTPESQVRFDAARMKVEPSPESS